jgi:hypothetical protein
MKSKAWCPIKIMPLVLFLPRVQVVRLMDEDYRTTLNSTLVVYNSFNSPTIVTFYTCETYFFSFFVLSDFL